MNRAWHTLEPKAVFEALHSAEGGLTVNEAVRRLKQDGLNVLPAAKADSLFLIFFRQFQSPLIYVLLIASIIVLAMGEIADGLIILVVLLFNSIAGAVQEGRAQNTLLALKRFTETTATVVRDGKEMIIHGREVVRGDILVFHEGEKIPADARILLSNSLKADEASLTGESEPVNKVTDISTNAAASPAEQRNMLFKGTTVVAGSGRAVAVATGTHTVIGSIAKKLSTIDSEIPLKANIRYLSRIIIGLVGLISLGLFALGLYRGEELTVIFTTVVSLAVSVIPEGLPIVITLVLATGVWRMSKRNALVKKLQAVEALGQAEIIAVDKTGTVTKNELVVREVWMQEKTFVVGGVGYEPKGAIEMDGSPVASANHPELLLVGKYAALGASARVSYSEDEKRWMVAGDPTEAAMRVFGEKVGFIKDELIKESPLLSEIPFDYRLKYHAVVHKVGGKNVLVVNGAPEEVLALCTRIRRDGKSYPLGKKDKQELEGTFIEMSQRGLRVVATASRERVPASVRPEEVAGLTFTAFFGMQDALRPEVSEAMARASAAGIKVVMITGDHALTARSIAKEAGIWREGEEVLEGAQVEEMSDAELAARIEHVSVFARVTPEHKLRIINAYKSRKQIVAMTGDGVNDAPPLVAADLGVAMGGIGTEVAKEAADIVLLDDNFGSIVSAVEEGRNIYKTIQKVILYLFSTSLGEVLVIVVALILGYPLPLLASQIIWLNLVTDGFLTVALAMEPKEEGLLTGRFRRPRRDLLDGTMAWRMVLMAGAMMVGTLYLFDLYLPEGLDKALTVSLTALAVFQWFNAYNCRSQTQSVFKMNLLSNKYLLGATALVVFLQVLAVYNPYLQALLHTVPLSLTDWFVIVPVALSVLLVEEVRKALVRWLHSAKKKETGTAEVPSAL